ncbi:MAG: pilus assembly protein [Acidimicrobiia bacterium]|nr:pilus assembly protein [Acidimicrobiia bacterium]
MNRRAGDRERGASLVEFALVAPLLFIVLFGIIEVSWAFNQQLEVRHGARESARLAATNYGDLSTIVTETCARMDHTAGGASVTLASTGAAAGDAVRVTVNAPWHTLTGVFDAAFGGRTIGSSAEMRIEQIPSWSDGTLPCP